MGTGFDDYLAAEVAADEIIREHAREVEDAESDAWIADNRSALVKEFAEELEDEFEAFCISRYREARE